MSFIDLEAPPLPPPSTTSTSSTSSSNNHSHYYYDSEVEHQQAALLQEHTQEIHSALLLPRLAAALPILCRYNAGWSSLSSSSPSPSASPGRQYGAGRATTGGTTTESLLPWASFLVPLYEDTLASARKVWMPLAVFAVIGCCHLLGYGMLVYSAFAIGSRTHAGHTSKFDGGGIVITTTTNTPLPPHLAPAPGAIALADFQGLGFLVYMASILSSFFWLQHYIYTRRQEQMEREERLRGTGTGPLGA